MFNPAAYPERHMSMEGIYEYGSRAGVWRLLREFEKRGLPLTVFGVGMALQRYPELAAGLRRAGPRDRLPRPEAGSTTRTFPKPPSASTCGWPWHIIQQLDRRSEPLGWYTGRDSPNTRRLVADFGGFDYDSDYYGDDLPFWMKVRKSDGSAVPQLIVPYTLDCNDMRFALPQGYSHADPFFQYLQGQLRRALRRRRPRRQRAQDDEHRHALPPARAARPHRRAAALPRPHRSSTTSVWVCRRIDIARHWAQTHPCKD